MRAAGLDAVGTATSGSEVLRWQYGRGAVYDAEAGIDAQISPPPIATASCRRVSLRRPPAVTSQLG